jgi:hypothetical protein
VENPPGKHFFFFGGGASSPWCLGPEASRGPAGLSWGFCSVLPANHRRLAAAAFGPPCGWEQQARGHVCQLPAGRPAERLVSKNSCPSPGSSPAFIFLPSRFGVRSCLLCLDVGVSVGLPLPLGRWSAVNSVKSAGMLSHIGEAQRLQMACSHGPHLLHGGGLCGGSTCLRVALTT